MRSDHHIVSLSLGTIAEPSALVVVEPSTKVCHPKDVALCCEAWNKLIDQPWKIMSIGRRKWAHGF